MNTDTMPFFDNLLFGNTFAEMRSNIATNHGYPFYNVKECEDDGVIKYVIEIALAGFKREDIQITKEKNVIKIFNTNTVIDADDDDDNMYYRYRGISRKSFTKHFQLGPNVVVDDATFVDGILSVFLHTEIPEDEKTKTISIS